MATDQNPWPPRSGLSTPTVHASQATFNINYTITIDAPASLVFDLLCNTASYPQWNTWVPRVTIHSQPEGEPPESAQLVKGTSFTYHVVMDEKKPHSFTDTQLRISDVSTPDRQSNYITQETLQSDGSFFEDLSKVYRISWKGEGGFVSRGLRTERFHEIIVLDEKSCEVRTWEVMGGILARTVKWMYHKTLQEKFGVWCRDLKKAAEERYAKGSGADADKQKVSRGDL